MAHHPSGWWAFFVCEGTPIHTQNVCCMYTEKRLTVEEIAELVNRTPRTVRRWCAEIGMPFYGDARRDGNGSWRVPESTVIAYLEKEQTKQAVSDSAATPPWHHVKYGAKSPNQAYSCPTIPPVNPF